MFRAQRGVGLLLLTATVALAEVPVRAQSGLVQSPISELKIAVDPVEPTNTRIISADGISGGLITFQLDAGLGQTLISPTARSIDVRLIDDAGLVLAAAQTAAGTVTFHHIADGNIDLLQFGSVAPGLPQKVAFITHDDAGLGLLVDVGSTYLSDYGLVVDRTGVTESIRPGPALPAGVLAMAVDESSGRTFFSVTGQGAGRVTDAGFQAEVSQDAGVVTSLAFYSKDVLLVAHANAPGIEAWRVSETASQLLGTARLHGVSNISSIAVTAQALPGFPGGMVAAGSVGTSFSASLVLVGWEDFAAALDAGLPVIPLGDAGTVDGGTVDAGASDASVAADGGADGGASDAGPGVDAGQVRPTPIPGGNDCDPDCAPTRPCGCSTSSAMFALLCILLLLLRRKESP